MERPVSEEFRSLQSPYEVPPRPPSRVVWEGRAAGGDSRDLRFEFGSTGLWGFPKNNSGNGPPTCEITSTTSVNGFGVDNAGALIVPDAFSGVEVYDNSQMCGTQLGAITDPYGQAFNASAIDAVNGDIAVGNIFDNSGLPGSVSVYTPRSLTCSANLTNSNIFEMGGVAMAANGDCWADAINSGDVAVLVYFQGCTGAGVLATGFSNGFYGGVNIDNKGNLVTISLLTRAFAFRAKSSSAPAGTRIHACSAARTWPARASSAISAAKTSVS